MTIKSENQLPRYVSGQKSVMDGKALDGRTTPKQYPTPPIFWRGIINKVADRTFLHLPLTLYDITFDNMIKLYSRFLIK